MVPSEHTHMRPTPDSAHGIHHLAIIMDGNGRWAKQQGLSRSAGHKAGTEAAKRIVEECVALGIRHLTLYTFSTENWSRPKDEISYLFSLLVDFLKKELFSLEKQGVKLNILGEIEDLPFATKKALQHAVNKTSHCSKLTLNLALNYSGRLEVTRACKLFLESGSNIDTLTPEVLAGYLYTKGQPDPDLIIRTSGEQRISNFLIFQAAYSEFYFTDTFWPEFTPQELHKALATFSNRERRFGGLAPEETE